MKDKFKPIMTSLLAGAVLLTSAACGMAMTPSTLSITPMLISGDREETHIYGDINNDGKVTAADSLLIQRSAINLEHLDYVQNIAADVNNDGKATSADALEILRYTIHLKTSGRTGQEFTLRYTDETADTPDVITTEPEPAQTVSSKTETSSKPAESKPVETKPAESKVESKTESSEVESKVHVHTWGNTYQVQVGTQTIDVETDTDVPNEGYTVQETYEIVYEKCKDCGEEIIYRIFKNGKNVFETPDGQYKVTFMTDEEQQMWLWDHADLHNVGTYRKEERTEYVTVDVTYPGEGTHTEKITVQQQVPVYETWHDCIECGASERVN